MHRYWDAYRGLPAEVWLVSAIVLANRAGTMVVPFWAIYCTTNRGLGSFEVGLLLAFYGIGSIGGSFLGGVAASRYGAIPTQIVALAGSGIAFLGLSTADGFAELAAGIFSVGLIADAVRPAGATATMEFAPPQAAARSLALNRLAANLGMSIGPVIGGVLAEIDFRWLFYIDAASSLVAAAVAVIAFRRLLGWPGSANRTPAPATAAAVSAPATPQRPRSPWRDPLFLFVMLLLTFIACIFFQLLGAYPVHLHHALGFGPSEIGLLMAVNTVLIVLFELFVVHMLEHRNELRVVGWGALLICAGFGLMALEGGVLLAVLSVVLWTAGEILTMPIAAAFTGRRAERASRGAYMGVYSMSFSVAALVGPAAGMMVYEWSSSTLWIACLLCGAPLLAAFYALARLLEPRSKTVPLALPSNA